MGKGQLSLRFNTGEEKAVEKIYKSKAFDCHTKDEAAQIVISARRDKRLAEKVNEVVGFEVPFDKPASLIAIEEAEKKVEQAKTETTPKTKSHHKPSDSDGLEEVQSNFMAGLAELAVEQLKKKLDSFEESKELSEKEKLKRDRILRELKKRERKKQSEIERERRNSGRGISPSDEKELLKIKAILRRQEKDLKAMKSWDPAEPLEQAARIKQIMRDEYGMSDGSKNQGEGWKALADAVQSNLPQVLETYERHQDTRAYSNRVNLKNRQIQEVQRTTWETVQKVLTMKRAGDIDDVLSNKLISDAMETQKMLIASIANERIEVSQHEAPESDSDFEFDLGEPKNDKKKDDEEDEEEYEV